MKKKIGFCINSLEMGGAEKLLVDIIKALKDDYEISVLTKYKSNSYFYKEIQNDIHYMYLIAEEVEKTEKHIFQKIKHSILKKIEFKKFSKNQDVIIDFLDGDFYRYIKKLKNKETIIWLHLGYEELQKRKKIDKKLNFYKKIIVITKGMEEELKSKTKLKNIYMVYNLIDFQKIDKKLKEENKIETPYILTVCRLDEEQKDIGTLIKAFKKYKGKEKLYIIGDGPSRNQLEQLSKKLNLSDKIVFLGLKTNPYIYMKKAEAFILSSKSEGFGLVLVEALYCKTKVLSSDCKYGPREILLNGLVGELIEVENECDMLLKLENISKKEYLDKEIKKSLKRFEKVEIIKQIKNIIDGDIKC